MLWINYVVMWHRVCVCVSSVRFPHAIWMSAAGVGARDIRCQNICCWPGRSPRRLLLPAQAPPVGRCAIMIQWLVARIFGSQLKFGAGARAHIWMRFTQFMCVVSLTPCCGLFCVMDILLLDRSHSCQLIRPTWVSCRANTRQPQYTENQLILSGLYNNLPPCRSVLLWSSSISPAFGRTRSGCWYGCDVLIILCVRLWLTIL